MAYDYSALKGKIIEKFGSVRSFSKHMRISESSLSLKLNNEVYWRQQDIEKARSLLDIPIEEVGKYFFTTIVQYA